MRENKFQTRFVSVTLQFEMVTFSLIPHTGLFLSGIFFMSNLSFADPGIIFRRAGELN